VLVHRLVQIALRVNILIKEKIKQVQPDVMVVLRDIITHIQVRAHVQLAEQEQDQAQDMLLMVQPDVLLVLPVLITRIQLNQAAPVADQILVQITTVQQVAAVAEAK